MKESPLHKAFEEASKRIAADPAQQNVARQLGILRDIGVAFQDAGVQVTLEARSGRSGSASGVADMRPMLANGAICVEGERLDFFLYRDPVDGDNMSLKIFHAGACVLESESRYDADARAWRDLVPLEEPPARASSFDYGYDDEEWDDDFDDEEPPPAPERKPLDVAAAVTALLVEVKAQKDFTGRFNLGPDGAGLSVGKPFPVTPPLKLKGPDRP
jgi:hypothetical protein